MIEYKDSNRGSQISRSINEINKAIEDLVVPTTISGTAITPVVAKVTPTIVSILAFVDGDMVSIGGITYKLTDTIVDAYDVYIGLTPITTLIPNLLKAIDLSGAEGVDYGTGTLANPLVESSGSDVVAQTSGLSGNNILCSSSNTAFFVWKYLTNITVNLQGGLDQYIANRGKFVQEGINLYYFDGSDWKQISFV